MSNLTSSVPGAVTAFYNLLVAAGAAQSPSASVFMDALGQDEPNSYVCLGSTPSGKKMVESHEFHLAALGSLAQEETYEVWGYASVWAGDFNPQQRFADTWALYQNVVMTTYTKYSGGFGSLGGIGSPILGSQAPTSLVSMECILAEYTGLSDGQGFAGIVEFGYALKARITVA